MSFTPSDVMNVEAILSTISNHSSEAIWVNDYERNAFYWLASEQNRKRYLLPSSSSVDFWESGLHPDDRKEIKSGYDKAKNDPSVLHYEHEYRFKSSNGYVMIHDRMRFFRDPEGNVQRVVGIWSDLSIALEREKQAEHINELQEQLQKAKQAQSTEINEKIEMLTKCLQASANKRMNLALPTAEGLAFVMIDEIVYCEASRNYTTLHTEDGKKYIVSRTLKEYEELLEDYDFFRIHHSFLINMKAISKYVRGDGGHVVMKNGRTLDVSKRKKESFLHRISLT